MGCSAFKHDSSESEIYTESVNTAFSKTNEEIGEIRFTPTKQEHIAKTDNKVMYADNEILIVVKEGTDYEAVQQLATQYNAEIVGLIELTGDYQLRTLEEYTLDELNQLITKLQSEEIVASADLDYIFTCNENMYSYGNDKKWSSGLIDTSDCLGDSWGFETIETPAAWKLLKENENKVNPVRIGLIDAGFDTQHEDLKDCFVEVIYNTSSNEHGTHVAGTMAANTDNVEGICGVYPYGKNNLYAVSIGGIGEYSENGDWLYNSMFLKIAYAELILRNVKVINSSLGFNYYNPDNWNGQAIPNSGKEWDERKKFVNDNIHILADFLERLFHKGYDFVLVNAAGNDSNRKTDTIYDAKYNWWTCAISHEEHPDLYDRIIVVGSIDGTFHTSNFSNGGKRVDVYAPGEHIYSTAHGGYEDEFSENGNNTVWSGTSMASPHVAGVAAMVWAANNTLSGADVKKIICETANADKIFDDSSLRIIGQLHYDLVNARRAVAKALGIETDEESTVQNNGSILCWVVEKGSDSKLPNATVIARAADTNDLIEQTTTDSNGHFELILPEGKYILTVKEDSGRYDDYTSEVIEVKNQSVNYLDDWIKLTRKTTELSQYLGTNIDDFLAMVNDLQKVDVSDGSLEYSNSEIIISAKPNNKLIDFISIRGNSDYSLYGLWYGMLFSETDNFLSQKISLVRDCKSDYKYINLSNDMDISFHANTIGILDSISVFGHYLDSKQDVPVASNMYKENYKSIITALSFNDSINTIDYTLYDMNADGIPELVLKTGSCEADYKLSFYTYKENIGVLTIGDNFSGFHTTFYVDKASNSLCTQWGQMGVGGIAWYSFDGNSVSEFKRQDNIEYATPNVNFDNYDDAYAPYGDFSSLNTIYCFNSWDEGWVTFENGNSKAGVDLSLIDNY